MFAAHVLNYQQAKCLLLFYGKLFAGMHVTAFFKNLDMLKPEQISWHFCFFPMYTYLFIIGCLLTNPFCAKELRLYFFSDLIKYLAATWVFL